jgi:putative transposase
MVPFSCTKPCPKMRIRPPHAPNSFYHVTLRGNRQQPLFFDPHDHHRWQHLLSVAMSKYGARLHLYCWMTNHVHMVLECGDIPIFKTLHWAAGAYARAFNAKYAHVGHLFQDRYGSRLIDADEYLLQLIKYIHVNPVKAGMVAAPIEYRWSSYRYYAFARAPDWLTTDFILALFSTDQTAARAQMAAFTDAPDVVAESATPPEHSFMFESMINTADLDDLTQLACERFEIAESLLKGASRRRDISKVRAWVAWAAQQQGAATLSDVARYFDRQPSVLTRSIARYKHDFQSPSTK